MIFLLLTIGLAVGSGAAPTAALRTEQEIRIGNGATVQNTSVTLPQLVHFTRPEYTDEARRLEIEGAVTIQAEFDIEGRFKVLRIVKGLGHGLDENALAALKDWRFTPAYRSGQRVSVVTLIDVKFILFDDPKWFREHRQSEWSERDYRKEGIQSAIERHFEFFPGASPD
jgi:TonB family protein